MMENPFGGMFRYQTPEAPYGYQGNWGRDHSLQFEQSQMGMGGGFGAFGNDGGIGGGVMQPQQPQTQWAYTQTPNPLAGQSPGAFNAPQSNYQPPSSLGNLMTQPQRQTGMRSIWTGGY